MPSMRFRPLAIQDIRETCVFLRKQTGIGLASRYFDSVLSTARLLVDFPRMGSPCNYVRLDLKGLRRWPVKGFERWHIFYFPGATGPEVVRVLHSARDLDAIFDPVSIAHDDPEA